MRSFSPPSAMRSLRDVAEKLPNTTEWIAPGCAHTLASRSRSRERAAYRSRRARRDARPAAYFSVQFTVAQAPCIARLAFKYKCRVVLALGKMHVQTVVGNFQTRVAQGRSRTPGNRWPRAGTGPRFALAAHGRTRQIHARAESCALPARPI